MAPGRNARYEVLKKGCCGLIYASDPITYRLRYGPAQFQGMGNFADALCLNSKAASGGLQLT